MTTLTQALLIESGDCVAVAGAGGKTTLCWRLAQAVSAARGERAIFTTTTKIWQPADGTFDLVRIGYPLPKGEGKRPSEGPWDEGAVWRTACLAAAVEGTPNDAPVNGAGMPTVQTKLTGFTANEVCELHRRGAAMPRPYTTIVECDGARGLRIKAPGNGEPMIPPCADVVCVLANLDAIGQPLDERAAHRADRVAQLTQTMPGSLITPPLIVALLSHPDGGLKGIPARARKVAVLTQHGETTLHPDAIPIMRDLAKRGFDRAVAVAPRAPQPVLAVIPAPAEHAARTTI